MNKAVKEHEDAVMDNNNYLSDKIFKKYIEIRNKYICLSSSSR